LFLNLGLIPLNLDSMKRIISFICILVLMVFMVESCSKKTGFHAKKKGPVNGKAHGSFGHPTK